MKLKKYLTLGVSVFGLLLATPNLAQANDCTGALPGANCPLDEDTNAALTINNGVVLTIAGSVTLGHTIDGSVDDVGAIETSTTGITVNQTAEIGGIAPIDSIFIGDTDTWVATADITTNDDGLDANNGGVTGDIDLGAVDGGETLVLNEGLTIIGQIDGNAGDFLVIGQDTNGGTFVLSSAVDSIDFSIDSGDVTTEASLGATNVLADLAIGSDATLTLDGASNNTVTLDLDGGVTINAGNSLIVTTYTADANNGDVVIGLNRDAGVTNSGQLNFTGGGAVDLSNMELSINIESGTEVLVTERIENVIVGNAGATVLPTLIDTSFLYEFELVQDGFNADLEVTRADLDVAATNDNNRNAANLLLVGLFDSVDEAVQATQNNLSTASTQREFNEILESTIPVLNSGITHTANLVTNQTINLAQQRLAQLRSEGDVAGISAGDGYTYDYDEEIQKGGRVWAQVFGSVGEQAQRNEIDGYDIDSVGLTIGADTGGIDEHLTMGMAFTLADSKLNGEDAANTDLQLDTYQFSFYGGYNFNENWFYNGSLSYSLSQVHSVRSNVGGAGLTAKAQYDSEQLVFFSELGRGYHTGKWRLTPSVLSKYSYIETENFRERGAGGMNLSVSVDSVQALEVGTRFKSEWQQQLQNDLYFIAGAELGYSYDVIGDDAQAIASLQAGGQQQAIEGYSSQNNIFDFGLSSTVAADSWEIALDYDMMWRGDLLTHTGYIRSTYKF